MLLYGSFEEKGYTFEAYIPNSDMEPVAFELRILVGVEIKYALLVPLTYTPTFGVDAGDVQQLEAIFDQILGFIPEAHDFGTKEITALDKIEAHIGGQRLREHHQRWLNSPNRQTGQFEYTAGLFADRFADLLGGREAMDQWMKTTMPQFGGRTPEEALRLGMAQEVINHLLKTASQKSTDASGT